ncbi:CD276 antigen-like isoform X8 [Anguilla anguilla]|uniref:CD276 antigen-like isoform X8 n=1 Tax=Anguilla anguilla TaxID=7936 RepID=UPI0015A8FBE5|nr:CD276 antigen-like isoform X8 [Anguilla anguilla]
MTTASFGVLVGLLLAQLAVFCVGLSVSVGDSLTLPCHGDPSRDVEWRFQQYEYPEWLPVAELHTGSFSPGCGFQGRVESFYLTEPGNYSLTLSPLVYSDLGIYECRYMDGIILSDVKLEIRGPSSVPVAMGNSANLPCFGNINIQACADDLDILWMRDGENVYQLHKNTIAYGPRFENRASVSPEQALYGNMSLTIRQTRFSDEGKYQCFYSSPKESGNPDSIRLLVTGHPPQNLTVEAGGLLSIPLYTADPVRVTFSAGLGSDEVLMLDANKGPARYGERCAQRCELLAQNYTLLLWSVTLEDAGVYKVTDPETNKTISSVSLEVSAPPLSAGAVAGIVLGVLGVLGVLLVLGPFAFWKFLKKPAKPAVCYQAASAEDQNSSSSRAAVILIPDSPEPFLLGRYGSCSPRIRSPCVQNKSFSH